MRLIDADSGPERVTRSEDGGLKFFVRVPGVVTRAFALLQGFELRTESGDRQLNRAKVLAAATEYARSGNDTLVTVQVQVQMPDDGKGFIAVKKTIAAKAWVILVVPEAGEV